MMQWHVKFSYDNIIIVVFEAVADSGGCCDRALSDLKYYEKTMCLHLLTLIESDLLRYSFI